MGVVSLPRNDDILGGHGSSALLREGGREGGNGWA